MLGAVFGDILGSYYESYTATEYNFPFHPVSTFTDDTVLTMAVCRAVLNNTKDINCIQIRKRGAEYVAQYRHFYNRFPNAGYGQMFSEWARKKELSVSHSFGNGAAMRVVPIGFAYDTLKQVLLQAKASAYFTHRSREALKSAQAVASAVFLARKGKSKEEIINFLENRFHYDLSLRLDDIRKDYEFNSRASYSVPPAIIAFLESSDYESAVRNAIYLGGDADTQAAIAGGIAEAFYKEIPQHIYDFCYSRIDISFRMVISDFYAKYI